VALAADFHGLALVVRLVEEELQRRLENLGDLEIVELEVEGGVTRPTTGVTTKPVPVRYSGSRPRISTCPGAMPTSSSASRRAVCSAEASLTSQRPPGKLT
jgi:hypothetical protein